MNNHSFAKFLAAMAAVAMLATALPAQAAGERRGGGGGGGGGAAAAQPRSGGGGAANANAGGGRQNAQVNNTKADARSNDVRSTSVNNVNNSNNNVNVNRNVNVNTGNNGCCNNNGWDNDHPVAAAAVIGGTIAAIGSSVRSVPPGCVPVNYGGIVYQQCGATWYAPQGSQFMVVAPPY
jgi:hypothetical protein